MHKCIVVGIASPTAARIVERDRPYNAESLAFLDNVDTCLRIERLDPHKLAIERKAIAAVGHHILEPELMHEALTHRMQASRAYRKEMAFRFQDFERTLRRFGDIPPHNRPRSQGAINIEKEIMFAHTPSSLSARLHEANEP